MDASEVDVELGIELKPGVESPPLTNDASIESCVCATAAGDFTVDLRRARGPRDVVIEVKYCGVCHGDL